MRLYVILILLALFKLTSAQSGTLKKITLADAISATVMKHSPVKSESQVKALVAEVEKAYYDQVYQISRYNTLQHQATLMNDIERVANLRYEAGDIDLLEKIGMISRIAEIRTAISMLSDDMAINGNKLKLLLLTTEDMIPADSVLSMYALQKGDKAPSGFDPAGQFVFEKNRENLEFELNRYFKKIQYFQRVALTQADILMEINQIRYEKEDIDYAEFTQRVDEAFRIQLEYLQTLNLYNQTAIQLELYAY